MKNKLPILQKALDLSKEILIRTGNFPRQFRYSLGERIAGKMIDVQETLIEAVYSREKTALLERANMDLEKLRFMLRLANETGGLSHKGFGFVSSMVNELGCQIGGWLKQAGRVGTCQKD